MSGFDDDAGAWSGKRRAVGRDAVADVCLATAAEVAETVAFLTPEGPAVAPAPADQAIVIEVGFEGHAHGDLTVALGAGVAQGVARGMLAIPDGEPIAADVATEAAKELANILAGNVLAALWGAEAEFHLLPPRLSTPRVLAGDPVIGLACVEGAIALSVDATCRIG